MFGSIYSSNIEDVESIVRINEWLGDMQADNIDLAGDFNVTLDPTLDRELQNEGAVRDYCGQRSRAVRETLDAGTRELGGGRSSGDSPPPTSAKFNISPMAWHGKK